MTDNIKRIADMSGVATAAVLGTAAVSTALLCVIPTYYNKLFNPEVVHSLNDRKQISPTEVVHSLNKKKQIALTFDDGPSPEFTGELLDILKRNHVRATFFVVVKKAEQNKALITRMIDEGHSIGMHSYEHANALLKGYSYTKEDFKKCKNFADSLKVRVKYFRPPWGHSNMFTSYFARKNGFKLITWNVMAQDWKANTSSKEIALKLIHRVKAGSIICLHDAGGVKNAPRKTLDALKKVIPILKASGFEFALLK